MGNRMTINDVKVSYALVEWFMKYGDNTEDSYSEIRKCVGILHETVLRVYQFQNGGKYLNEYEFKGDSSISRPVHSDYVRGEKLARDVFQMMVNNGMMVDAVADIIVPVIGYMTVHSKGCTDVLIIME